MVNVRICNEGSFFQCDATERALIARRGADRGSALHHESVRFYLASYLGSGIVLIGSKSSASDLVVEFKKITLLLNFSAASSVWLLLSVLCCTLCYTFGPVL